MLLHILRLQAIPCQKIIERASKHMITTQSSLMSQDKIMNYPVVFRLGLPCNINRLQLHVRAMVLLMYHLRHLLFQIMLLPVLLIIAPLFSIM